MTVPILGGAPLKYTAEEFEKKINEYFIYIDDVNVKRKLKRFEGEKFKPFTLSGICVYLGISRETWNEYSKKNGYIDTIKRTKTIVENYAEEGLLNGSLNAIGAIFNLKNNFGWVDKIEVNATCQPEQLSASDIHKQLETRKKDE